MREKIELIREWLGTGSIDIFGKPLCGKDTVGRRIAEELSARFLSSGDIIRAAGDKVAKTGRLTPTNVFYDLVLPYFGSPELDGLGLVLSSVGRWSGEENEVMKAAMAGGHPVKVAIEIEVSDAEVKKRRIATLASGDRGYRADDASDDVLAVRLREFAEKTIPVIKHYEDLGLLVKVNGAQERNAVYEEVVARLTDFINGK